MVSEPGLTSEQAAERLRRDGLNELRGAAPVPRWRRMVAQFRDPLVYLLLGAMAVALAAWLWEGRDETPVDVVVIGAVVLANAVLGFVQEARARNAVAALQQMTMVTSSVLRDGQVRRLPSAELVVGDLLLLEEGDAVGADARVVAAAELRIQESSLTGESEATTKSVVDDDPHASLGDRPGAVFKGTAVVQGTGRAVVTATGMDTEMGAIAILLESTEDGPTPLQREIGRIGRTLGVGVLVIAVVVVVTVLLVSDIRTVGDVVTVLLLGVSLAVAAVPEGLPAILSVVLALGMQRMASRKAIIKDLSSVETLGSASVIATDKTGTLTKSEMTLERLSTASGQTTISGVGYAPIGQITAGTADSTTAAGGLGVGALRTEAAMVLRGGSLSNNAGLRLEQDHWLITGDPTEAAFLVAEAKLGLTGARAADFQRLAEIPFTSERKLMSTVQAQRGDGDRRLLVTKGAPDVLLDLCDRIRSDQEVLTLTPTARQAALDDVSELSDRALRTLSVAYRPLADEEDADSGAALEQHLIFAGTAGIIDPPRPEVAVAIAEAHRAGIRVVMITGDHPRTALRIAADLGIVSPAAQVITGVELDRLDEGQLADVVGTVSVYARVAPRHKLAIVAALQAAGEIVAMTGDGVNDAPALKAADLGIAMGQTGTEVTKEAAAMILVDDNFATIVNAVREGRGIFDNIQKFLRYLLSSNMGEVLTVFLGVVLAGVLGLNGHGEAVVLPLLATQILWVNLVTDSGPALAMGIDPETEDVMARSPRRQGDRVIDLRMWVGVITIGAVMAMVTLAAIDGFLPGGLIEGSDDLATARTAGFTVLVLAQLFNCFNARSETESAFQHLFVNHWLWLAVGVSLALQVAVVEMPLLNTAFGTAPLDAGHWLTCLALASAVLWAAELRKLVLRRLDRRPASA